MEGRGVGNRYTVHAQPARLTLRRLLVWAQEPIERLKLMALGPLVAIAALVGIGLVLKLIWKVSRTELADMALAAALEAKQQTPTKEAGNGHV